MALEPFLASFQNISPIIALNISHIALKIEFLELAFSHKSRQNIVKSSRALLNSFQPSISIHFVKLDF